MLEVKRKPDSPSHGSKASAISPIRRENPKTDIASEGSLQIVSQALKSRPDSSSSEKRIFQNKMPVITGEVQFKGVASIEGLLTGQMGPGNGLSLQQKCSTALASQPELEGEFSFKDMVRVNGHIAGTVFSESGTLIVDTGARLDASVDVAVALIGGCVTGDIVARERVELGPASKIQGNIFTRSIVIKHGAIFEGVCRMIEEAQKAC